MHIGVFERDPISFSSDYPARVWITHWTQENLVYIIFKWDEDLVLEILEARRSKDWERDDRT